MQYEIANSRHLTELYNKYFKKGIDELLMYCEEYHSNHQKSMDYITHECWLNMSASLHIRLIQIFKDNAGINNSVIHLDLYKIARHITQRYTLSLQ